MKVDQTKNKNTYFWLRDQVPVVGLRLGGLQGLAICWKNEARFRPDQISIFFPLEKTYL
jgi:hypothetical protein